MDGKDEIEHLFDRVLATNASFDLGLTEEEVETIIHDAVGLANSDVGNFQTPDQAFFLSNTWKLLPESNIDLRHTNVFRISNFTLALKKMLGFFSHLDTDLIFLTFRGMPNKEDLSDLRFRARKNLDIAKRYMDCKLLSISVLGAMAELTGGDTPVAMFMGDLPELGYVSPSADDYIPKIEPKNELKLNRLVHDILRDGRADETSFDLKHSPIAAYIYGLVGDIGVDRSLEYAVYPMDAENARKLLSSLPGECVKQIGLACAEIAVTRSKALKVLVQEYNNSQS